MRLWLTAVVLIFSLGGCGGPVTDQVSSAYHNNVPASVRTLGGFTAPAGAQTTHPCVDDENQSTSQYFAAPICTQYWLQAKGSDGELTENSGYYTADEVDNISDSTKTDFQVEFVSQAVTDSRQKCSAFIDMFTTGQSLNNLTSDSASIILSGLGALFTPVATVRALSAASTAVQGLKQTKNTDFYQNLTMVLLVQQIQASYFDKMDTEFPDGSSLGGPNFSASAKFAEIEDIHRNCSVPFAVAALSAKASLPASAMPTAATSWTVTITGTATPGDQVSITPEGSEVGLKTAIPPYTVVGSSLQDIAIGLRNAIYASVGTKYPSITAMVNASASGDSATLTLQGGPADLTWDNPTAKNASGGVGAEIVTITGGPNGSTTSSATLGAAAPAAPAAPAPP